MGKWVCVNGHKVDDDRNVCVRCSTWRSGAPVELGSRPPDPLAEPLDGQAGVRWQYAAADIGANSSADRLTSVLARAGEAGWELVGVYDKSSAWSNGGEKGFVMLKRPVPEGATPSAWCVRISV